MGFGSGRAFTAGVPWRAAHLGSRFQFAIWDRFVAALLAERERWLLWMPVGLGFGVAIYFGFPKEPMPWSGAAISGIAAVVAMVMRRRPVVAVFACACAILAGGFALAQFRVERVSAPFLSKPVLPASVTGRVVEYGTHGNGHRLLLDRVRISRLDVAATPERVRINLRGSDVLIVPGDWIAIKAGLSPPPPPSSPGAFDFARKAYFAGIGGVGFALGPARRITPPEGETDGGLRAVIGRLRHAVTSRVLAAADGQAAAVAAALLTGHRGSISEEVLAAMRDAGLAHLLAISGLHLGLVAGIVFYAVRLLLALCEPIALRWPIKKWAACAALAGTAFYLLLSGATIPTQRAFLMSGLVIVAILLDRTGVSMRSVAWAATAVLVIQPDSLLGPSFQMSFAAVVALVATYEGLRNNAPGKRMRESTPRRLAAYFAGVALVTIVAGFATAPFAIYHFNRIAAYGLAANLLAVPITALWIMPWGVVTLALMPFSLESWALTPMIWGIDLVISVATAVAAWPGAVKLLPAMPMAGLAAVVGGGLWLCLWRRRWRWLGALAIAAGLLTPGMAQQADLLIDGAGKLVAVQMTDGRLALSSTKKARYAGELWLRRNGQAAPAPWPGKPTMLRCDSAACLYRTRKFTISLVHDARALSEDCRIVDGVVSSLWIRQPCPTARVFIDGADLWCRGAHALYLTDIGIRVEHVAGHRGERPWSPRRAEKC